MLSLSATDMMQLSLDVWKTFSPYKGLYIGEKILAMEPTMFFALFAHPVHTCLSIVGAELIKILMPHLKASDLHLSVNSMLWVF